MGIRTTPNIRIQPRGRHLGKNLPVAKVTQFPLLDMTAALVAIRNEKSEDWQSKEISGVSHKTMKLLKRRLRRSNPSPVMYLDDDLTSLKLTVATWKGENNFDLRISDGERTLGALRFIEVTDNNGNVLPEAVLMLTGFTNGRKVLDIIWQQIIANDGNIVF